MVQKTQRSHFRGEEEHWEYLPVRENIGYGA